LEAGNSPDFCSKWKNLDVKLSCENKRASASLCKGIARIAIGAAQSIPKWEGLLMKTQRFSTLVVVLVSAFGLVQAANAADRFFEIQVKMVSGSLSPFFGAPSPPDPNCYSFLEDGTWVDPLFPTLGLWVPEESNGVVEQYTAAADWDGIPDVLPPLLLIQEGQITPTTGNGQVRLQAFSTLYLRGTDIVLASFMSTGHEVDECP
jgi:hypothetical protein